MSRRFYVKDKMPGLCHTCRHGHRMESESGSVRVYCTNMSEFVKEPLKDCSEYMDQDQLTAYDMEKTAYIIRTDAYNKILGFVRPGTEEHKKLRNPHAYD